MAAPECGALWQRLSSPALSGLEGWPDSPAHSRSMSAPRRRSATAPTAQRLREPGGEPGAILQFAFVDDERPPAHGGVGREGARVARAVAGDLAPANSRHWPWACGRRAGSRAHARSSRARKSPVCAPIDNVRPARQVGAVETVAGRDRAQQLPAPPAPAPVSRDLTARMTAERSGAIRVLVLTLCRLRP